MEVEGVTIEHDVHFTKKKSTGKWGKVLAAMKPGDSIIMPVNSKEAMRYHANRTQCEISMRKVDEGNIRVWLLSRSPKGK